MRNRRPGATPGGRPRASARSVPSEGAPSAHRPPPPPDRDRLNVPHQTVLNVPRTKIKMSALASALLFAKWLLLFVAGVLYFLEGYVAFEAFFGGEPTLQVQAASLTTENGFYYSFYDAFVQKPTWAEAWSSVLYDDRSEWPSVINALTRFNIWPEVVMGCAFRAVVLPSLQMMATWWRAGADAATLSSTAEEVLGGAARFGAGEININYASYWFLRVCGLLLLNSLGCAALVAIPFELTHNLDVLVSSGTFRHNPPSAARASSSASTRTRTRMVHLGEVFATPCPFALAAGSLVSLSLYVNRPHVSRLLLPGGTNLRENWAQPLLSFQVLFLLRFLWQRNCVEVCDARLRGAHRGGAKPARPSVGATGAEGENDANRNMLPPPSDDEESAGRAMKNDGHLISAEEHETRITFSTATTTSMGATRCFFAAFTAVFLVSWQFAPFLLTLQGAAVFLVYLCRGMSKDTFADLVKLYFVGFCAAFLLLGFNELMASSLFLSQLTAFQAVLTLSGQPSSQPCRKNDAGCGISVANSAARGKPTVISEEEASSPSGSEEVLVERADGKFGRLSKSRSRTMNKGAGCGGLDSDTTQGAGERMQGRDKNVVSTTKPPAAPELLPRLQYSLPRRSLYHLFRHPLSSALPSFLEGVLAVLIFFLLRFLLARLFDGDEHVLEIFCAKAEFSRYPCRKEQTFNARLYLVMGAFNKVDQDVVDYFEATYLTRFCWLGVALVAAMNVVAALRDGWREAVAGAWSGRCGSRKASVENVEENRAKAASGRRGDCADVGQSSGTESCETVGTGSSLEQEQESKTTAPGVTDEVERPACSMNSDAEVETESDGSLNFNYLWLWNFLLVQLALFSFLGYQIARLRSVGAPHAIVFAAAAACCLWPGMKDRAMRLRNADEACWCAGPQTGFVLRCLAPACDFVRSKLVGTAVGKSVGNSVAKAASKPGGGAKKSIHPSAGRGSSSSLEKPVVAKGTYFHLDMCARHFVRVALVAGSVYGWYYYGSHLLSLLPCGPKNGDGTPEQASLCGRIPKKKPHSFGLGKDMLEVAAFLNKKVLQRGRDVDGGAGENLRKHERMEFNTFENFVRNDDSWLMPPKYFTTSSASSSSSSTNKNSEGRQLQARAAATPPGALAASMSSAGSLRLLSEFPLAVHPHYEHSGLRRRVQQLYTALYHCVAPRHFAVEILQKQLQGAQFVLIDLKRCHHTPFQVDEDYAASAPGANCRKKPDTSLENREDVYDLLCRSLFRSPKWFRFLFGNSAYALFERREPEAGENEGLLATGKDKEKDVVQLVETEMRPSKKIKSSPRARARRSIGISSVSSAGARTSDDDGWSDFDEAAETSRVDEAVLQADEQHDVTVTTANSASTKANANAKANRNANAITKPSPLSKFRTSDLLSIRNSFLNKEYWQAVVADCEADAASLVEMASTFVPKEDSRAKNDPHLQKAGILLIDVLIDQFPADPTVRYLKARHLDWDFKQTARAKELYASSFYGFHLTGATSALSSSSRGAAAGGGGGGAEVADAVESAAAKLLSEEWRQKGPAWNKKLEGRVAARIDELVSERKNALALLEETRPAARPGDARATTTTSSRGIEVPYFHRTSAPPRATNPLAATEFSLFVDQTVKDSQNPGEKDRMLSRKFAHALLVKLDSYDWHHFANSQLLCDLAVVIYENWSERKEGRRLARKILRELVISQNPGHFCLETNWELIFEEKYHEKRMLELEAVRNRRMWRFLEFLDGFGSSLGSPALAGEWGKSRKKKAEWARWESLFYDRQKVDFSPYAGVPVRGTTVRWEEDLGRWAG